MVPGIANGIARNSGFQPMFVDVVPDVPLMATGHAAFVSPDELLAEGKLVDVEFQSLRNFDVLHEEVNVVGEVMELWHQSVVGIVNVLRGEVSDQVVVPEYVSPLNRPAAVDGFCRSSAQRWRTDLLRPAPFQLRPCGRASLANEELGRQQCET